MVEEKRHKPADTNEMDRKGLLGFTLGLVIVLMLILLEQWLFKIWLHTSHLQWYLQNGALIGLVSSVVSMTWGDINKHTGLISAHPLTYLGACFQLAGTPIFVMGTHLRSNQNNPGHRTPFDSFITIILTLALTVIIFVWVLVVVPLQYFIYLVCGAPARLFDKSDQRTIARLEDNKLTVKVISKQEQIPDSWWDASLTSKPVSMTNLFASMFFLIIKPFIS